MARAPLVVEISRGGRGDEGHVVLHRGHVVQLLQLVYRRVVERHVLLVRVRVGVRVKVEVKVR